LKDLTDDKIKKLAKRYISESIESWDRDYFEDCLKGYPGATFYELLPFVDDLIDRLSDGLKTGDLSSLEKETEHLLQKSGINDIDRRSIQYRKLCSEIHRVEISLLPMHRQHMLYDYSYKKKLPKVFPEYFGPADDAMPISKSHNSKLLSTVITHFVAEKEKHSWTQKTKHEMESSLRLFIEVVGDIPIESIQRKHIDEFKNILQKLPPHRNRNKAYRDKSIQELLKMNVKKTLAVNTINKLLARVSTLFAHAHKNGFTDGDNPASNMALPKSNDAADLHAAKNTPELEQFFQRKIPIKISA
jgi:hypothetical protein